MTETLFKKWRQEDEISGQGIVEDLEIAQEPTEEPVEENLLSKWAKEDNRGVSAQTNLRVAEMSDPEVSAKNANLSRRSGLPESAVKVNPTGIERALDRVGPAILATSPILNAAYAGSLAFSKIAFDDAGPLAVLERTADKVIKEYNRVTDNIGTSYEQGKIDTIVNELYNKKRENILAGVVVDVDDAELDAQILAATTPDQFEVILPPEERPEAANIVETGLNVVARMVPLYKQLAVATAKGAAIYGPSTFAMTGFNPVFAAPGAMAGVLLETSKVVFNFEAGAAFREFSQERDVNGDLMKPELAAAGATAVGAINAALEVASLGYMVKQAKIIPGIKQGLNFFIKGAVKKALTKSAVKTTLVSVAKRYAKAVTFEAATEATQEITNILIGESLKGVSEEIEDTYFTGIDWAKDFWPRVFEAFEEGGAAAGVMMGGFGIITQTANVTSKAIRAQNSQKYTENTAEVFEAAETKTKERSPEEMKGFVDKLNLPKESYVSHDAILFQEQTEETNAILDKLGLTREEVLTRISNGQDIQISTSDVHAKLTSEEFAIVKDDIKASPGAFSARDLKTFDMAVEADVFADAVREDQLYNRLFQDEMKRLRADVKELGYGTKYADDYVAVLDRVSETFYPNVEDKLDFAKRIKSVNFLQDISPTKEDFKDKGLLAKIAKKVQTAFQTKKGTESKAFKNWFKDSKVVGQDGAPMIVYHGTGVDIDAFKAGDLNWVTPDEVYASGYGEKVIPLYANISDPFDYGFRSQHTHVRLSNMTDRIIQGLNERFAEGKIKKEKALELVERARELGESSAEFKHVFEWWNSKEELVDILKDAGYDGLTAREGVEDKTPTYAVFDNTQLKSVDSVGFSVSDPRISFQGEEVVQGVHRFDPETHEHVVSLFRDKDASSLLHETGHVFMKEMGYVVSRGLATEQLTKDYAAFQEWLGVKEDGKISTAQQEKFANAFEQYIYEGKAPTSNLAATFQRFKNWLLTVYQKYAGTPELSPEVRDLFDRMFTAKQSVMEGAANNDMQSWSPDQMEAVGVLQGDRVYMNRLDRQTKEQAEALMLKDMNTQLRELKPEWRKEAESLLSADRSYRTASFFREGSGISIEALKEGGYSEATIKKLKGSRVAKLKGASLFEAQTFGGYKNDSALVDAMVQAPLKNQFTKDHVQRKTTEHISSFKPDDYLSQTKAYSSLLEIKDRYIKRSLGIPTEVKPAKAVKIAAEKWMDGQPVRDATRVDRFLSEQAKWSRKETSAVHAKDYETASEAMNNARFNYELAKLAVKNKEKVIAFKKKTTSLARRDPKKYDPDFRDAIYTVIQNFDAPGTPKAVIEKKNINVLDYVYATEKDAARDPFPMDPRLTEGIEGGISYKDISMGALENLNDMLKYLSHHGKKAEEKNILIGEYKGATVSEVSKPMAEESIGLKKKGPLPENSVLQGLVKRTRGGYSQVDSFNMIARSMGGYISRGKNSRFSLTEQNTYLKLNKSQEVEFELVDEYKKKTAPHFDQLLTTIENLTKKFGAKMTHLEVKNPRIMQEGGQTGYWKPSQIIALAANMGNPSNKTRIFDGFPGLTEQDLNTLVGILDKKDWEALSAIGKVYDELYVKSSEVYRNVNGVKNTGIEISTVQTPFGEMDGWYAPIRYDKDMAMRSSVKGVDKIAESFEKADLMARFDSKFRPAKAQAKFMISREVKTKYPLLLDIQPLMSHIVESSHYIAFAESIEDVKNLIHSKDMEQATTRHLGADVYNTWKKTLAYIANPRSGPQLSTIERDIQKAKRWGTAVVLGYNTNVALKQGFSAFDAIDFIGKRGFAKTYAKAASNPIQMKRDHQFMIEHSTQMANREGGFQQEFIRQMGIAGAGKTNIKLPAKIVKALDLDPTRRYTYDDIIDIGFLMIKGVDMATVTPLWTEAYNQKLAENQDHKASVVHANHVIRSTQPMSESMDLTLLQSGKGPLSLAAMFGTYRIGKFQQNVRFNFRAWRSGKMSTKEALEKALWLGVVPAVAISYLNAARYEDSGDEHNWGTILTDAAKSLVTLGIPVYGDVLASMHFFMSPYPVSLSPLEGAMRKYKYSQKSVAKAVEGVIDGDSDAGDVFYALVEMLGIAFQAPVTNLVETFPFNISEDER